MPEPQALSLSQLNNRVSAAIADRPDLRDVWVVGETVDVRSSGSHCYLELIEKDDNGVTVARMRATIWASNFYHLVDKFRRATGRDFSTGLKVMVRGSVGYHKLYGLSIAISDINPTFTLGDILQRRMQMVERLREEGILTLNRELPWPMAPQRIAIISARTGAGYGDFIKHLFGNPYRLAFRARLFPAVMQGERTAQTVIAALDEIYSQADQWDCVVIIRGGGGTSDLIAFDSYEMAANIAQFPLPIISGVGHDRDTTLIDYVSSVVVKTPTAAADVLIQRGADLLAHLQTFATSIHRSVANRLAECHRHLATAFVKLPASVNSAVASAHTRLDNVRLTLSSISAKRLRPALSAIDRRSEALNQSVKFAIERERRRLETSAKLLDALSPEAVLRRGYTMTEVDGHIIASAASLSPGSEITTIFADGEVRSKIQETKLKTKNRKTEN